MTENEYVRVSDLARVRAARSILADVLSGGDHMGEVLARLVKVEEALYAKVKIR